MSELFGVSVSIQVTDPWELGELRFRGRIVALSQDPERVLIELSAPFLHKTVSYRFVVASPRAVETNLLAIKPGETVQCAHIGVADLQDTDRVPDLKHWRGGLAFIGDVVRE